MTFAQLVPSANAPWTRTMFFTVCCCDWARPTLERAVATNTLPARTVFVSFIVLDLLTEFRIARKRRHRFGARGTDFHSGCGRAVRAYVSRLHNLSALKCRQRRCSAVKLSTAACKHRLVHC